MSIEGKRPYNFYAWCKRRSRGKWGLKHGVDPAEKMTLCGMLLTEGEWSYCGNVKDVIVECKRCAKTLSWVQRECEVLGIEPSEETTK